MTKTIRNRLFLYQVTAVFSVIFALAGFSYNVWRLEVSEKNNNVRTACFEMLTELASLEQLIYTAAYDGDLREGSPRKGWVKVGLVNDLSMLTSTGVENSAEELKVTWSNNWDNFLQDSQARDQVIGAIDGVRSEIKKLLASLE